MARSISGSRSCIVFFFFQAEDGIRDIGVTGVQTCALPISFGNFAFKMEIRNRMIFHLHRQSLIAGIKRWSLGYGPRFQYTVHFESEVVMQMRSAVLLHHKTMLLASRHLAFWLGRLAKSALFVVLL